VRVLLVQACRLSKLTGAGKLTASTDYSEELERIYGLSKIMSDRAHDSVGTPRQGGVARPLWTGETPIGVKITRLYEIVSPGGAP